MEREPKSPSPAPACKPKGVLTLAVGDRFAAELGAVLLRLGRPCVRVRSTGEAVEALAREDLRLAFLEMGADGEAALESLDGLVAARPGLPIVAFVDPRDRESAVDALRRGALLVLDKPTQDEGLESAVRLGLHLGKLSEVRFPEPALQGMVELQQGLASCLEEEELLDLLLQLLIRHLRSDSGSLLLMEADRQHLRLSAAYGLDAPSARGYRVRLGDRVCGWVAEHDRPQMIVGQGGDDPRLADPARVRRPAVGLCLPMRGETGVRGVVCLGRDEPDELFLPADVELGLLLAGEVARALERREALELRQDLERRTMQCDKLAALGELAAGVAHEINNPLAFVTSNLNSLRDYLRDLLPVLNGMRGAEAAVQRAVARLRSMDLEFLLEDLPRCLDETQQGIGRVLRIVQDLRNLSREDREVKELASPNQIVEGALNVIWNQLKHKAGLERALGEVPSLPCFPSLLGQAVLNLLSNAAHAVEKDGRVVVRTRAEDGGVAIEVEDDGCGMPPEVQAKLFQPFFTTKPRGVGTGLGMAVVKRAVEMHSGRIEVRSEVGRGTRFKIWIPVPELEGTGA